METPKKLTYEEICALPSGSIILEHYHHDWADIDGKMEFKLSLCKGVPYLKGKYGGRFKLKPEDVERNEYFLIALGTWRGGKKNAV